jgi:hypothetical protein
MMSYHYNKGLGTAPAEESGVPIRIIFGEGVIEEPSTTRRRRTNDPPLPPEEPGASLFSLDWVKSLVGFPEQEAPPSPAPMPGKTQSGAPTATGFSKYAGEAAIRAGAAQEDEIYPIEEAPESDPSQYGAEERSWIQRYQTHITIASTVIGLATFLGWLILRKKED